MDSVQQEIKEGHLDSAIKLIPSLLEKQAAMVEKYHMLHLSLLAEKIKRADTFYLARATKKEIKPHMMEWIKVYQLAFKKTPSWYQTGYSGAIDQNIENFWLDQRTIWNKAHKQEWNNNRDNTGRLMEYKR